MQGPEILLETFIEKIGDNARLSLTAQGQFFFIQPLGNKLSPYYRVHPLLLPETLTQLAEHKCYLVSTHEHVHPEYICNISFEKDMPF